MMHLNLILAKPNTACMPNNLGGIVDDLIIYRIKENTYLLVVTGVILKRIRMD